MASTDPTTGFTGLILAGGLGSRMGGVDKGLQPLGGRPLVAHVVERLAPQVGPLLINANRNADAYAAFGTVVADRRSGFPGPLAGIEAGLAACTTPLLMVVPCDTPYLPANLVTRLRTALETVGAELAVASCESRRQPVICLMRREVLSGLMAFLDRDERKVGMWQAGLESVSVEFEDSAAFANLNTQDELQMASQAQPR
ncbi:MAG: molybdenum cofactor guanylyltransferase [Zoogloea sp.]|nr:molybdenum cofactor guanylyltransferase [Zoogloea sp.]